VPRNARAPYHQRVNNLVVVLALQARRDGPAWAPGELERAIVWLLLGCAVAVAVFRLAPRVPWPRPFRWQFAAFHMIAAPVAALTWCLLSLAVETPMGWGASDLGPRGRFEQMMVVGCVFYFLVASLSYSSHGAARAAQAEAVAARTQLATLRSQLQPHFLFNALHTIVQLIHIDPRRAVEAAEVVADLLRRTLEEQRDEVPLRDEWSFVSRYLAVEQIRFGERLVVKADLPPDMDSEQVPSFALQTLVENAVQHGAAPRVAPTEIAITGTRSSSELVISVRNSGDSRETGVGSREAGGVRTDGNGTGTGLARLHQRLSVLYGGAATLVSRPIATGGYEAVLTVPRNRANDT
jgi:two-component system, LytTR family, sensor kinase